MDALQKKLVEMYQFNEKNLEVEDDKDLFAVGHKSGYLEALVAVSQLVTHLKTHGEGVECHILVLKERIENGD